MNITRLAPLALLTLAVFGAGSARADTNLLSDGDFESFASQVADGGYTAITAGSNLGAWSVSGQSVDLIRSDGYGRIAGVSVDLAGTPGPGYISQNFNAVAGTTYQLNWDYSKNGAGADMVVSVGDMSSTFTPASGIAHGSLSWTATSSGLQSVMFGTSSPSNMGPTLDNVTLTAAVPEPSSYALLMAGIGCVGLVTRRRSKQA